MLYILHKASKKEGDKITFSIQNKTRNKLTSPENTVGDGALFIIGGSE